MSKTRTMRATTTLYHAYEYLGATYPLKDPLCPRNVLYPVKVAREVIRSLHNIVLVLGDQTIEVEIE